MKDNSRKCAKCNSSTAKDSNVVLHRFPKPGPSNAERMKAWAKFCYPEENWSSGDFQKKLYTSHKMLCSKHFPESAFVEDNSHMKKLHRYAIPAENTATTSQTIETDIPSTLSVDNVTCQPGTSKSSYMEMSSSVEVTSQLTTQTTQSGTSKSLSVNRPEKTSREKHLLNKCRRNLRKICNLQKSIQKLRTKNILEALNNDDAVKQLSTNLTSSFAVLLQGQLFNCKRKKRGRRWNLHQKILALRLYKRSPACYRLLRRLFALPCQTSLKNLLNKLPLKPGINTHVFDAIKNFSKNCIPQDKLFSLLFDEMSIRKNLIYNPKYDQVDGFQDHGLNHGRDPEVASHALVFMISGIRKKIKQPVAYYLSGDHVTSDRLSVLIKEVLLACFDAGITIAATICDMDGANRRALSVLGVTTHHPYFTIGKYEIVALHDTPHLLKCFRNLFLKYDIKYKTDVECNGQPIGNIAKWSHIKQFFDLDSTNPFFVFAPALTQSHLNPNNKQKMKVKLAAQVFSHTVSAGMYAKITQGELPMEALATVNIINKIDQLFDSLNADTPSPKRGKKLNRNISDHSPHINYFRDMKNLMKDCEFIGARSRPPSLDGWIQTMTGVELLWRNLKRSYPDIGSLSTRRLQQDPLENCFGCIRSNCGSNFNPTVSQFVAGLKTSIISNLSTASLSTNCEMDEAIILDNLNIFLSHISPSTASPIKTTEIYEDSINIADMECDENSGEIQACAYVCGFIIKKNWI